MIADYTLRYDIFGAAQCVYLESGISVNHIVSFLPFTPEISHTHRLPANGKETYLPIKVVLHVAI